MLTMRAHLKVEELQQHAASILRSLCAASDGCRKLVLDGHGVPMLAIALKKHSLCVELQRDGRYVIERRRGRACRRLRRRPRCYVHSPRRWSAREAAARRAAAPDDRAVRRLGRRAGRLRGKSQKR